MKKLIILFLLVSTCYAADVVTVEISEETIRKGESSITNYVPGESPKDKDETKTYADIRIGENTIASGIEINEGEDPKVVCKEYIERYNAIYKTKIPVNVMVEDKRSK